MEEVIFPLSEETGQAILASLLRIARALEGKKLTATVNGTDLSIDGAVIEGTDLILDGATVEGTDLSF